MTSWLARHLGHRGAVLGLFGLVWCLIGVSMVPDANHPDTHVDGLLLFEHLPLAARIALWIAPGIVALVAAWMRGPGRDTLGFTLLIIPPIIRGGSYAWAWLTWVVSGGTIGEDRGWTGAIVWIAVAGVILITSSWREPGGFAPSPREHDLLDPLTHRDGDDDPGTR